MTKVNKELVPGRDYDPLAGYPLLEADYRSFARFYRTAGYSDEEITGLFEKVRLALDPEEIRPGTPELGQVLTWIRDELSKPQNRKNMPLAKDPDEIRPESPVPVLESIFFWVLIQSVISNCALEGDVVSCCA